MHLNIISLVAIVLTPPLAAATPVASPRGGGGATGGSSGGASSGSSGGVSSGSSGGSLGGGSSGGSFGGSSGGGRGGSYGGGSYGGGRTGSISSSSSSSRGGFGSGFAAGAATGYIGGIWYVPIFSLTIPELLLTLFRVGHGPFTGGAGGGSSGAQAPADCIVAKAVNKELKPSVDCFYSWEHWHEDNFLYYVIRVTPTGQDSHGWARGVRDNIKGEVSPAPQKRSRSG